VERLVEAESGVVVCFQQCCVLSNIAGFIFQFLSCSLFRFLSDGHIPISANASRFLKPHVVIHLSALVVHQSNSLLSRLQNYLLASGGSISRPICTAAPLMKGSKLFRHSTWVREVSVFLLTYVVDRHVLSMVIVFFR
jgi:hypothetical protein